MGGMETQTASGEGPAGEFIPEAVAHDLAARQERLGVWLWVAAMARVSQALVAIGSLVVVAGMGLATPWTAGVLLGMFSFLMIAEAACYYVARNLSEDRCLAKTLSAASGAVGFSSLAWLFIIGLIVVGDVRSSMMLSWILLAAGVFSHGSLLAVSHQASAQTCPGDRPAASATVSVLPVVLLVLAALAFLYDVVCMLQQPSLVLGKRTGMPVYVTTRSLLWLLMTVRLFRTAGDLRDRAADHISGPEEDAEPSDVVADKDVVPEAVARDVASRQQTMSVCLWLAALMRIGQLLTAVVMVAGLALGGGTVTAVAWGLLIILFGAETVCYWRAATCTDIPRLRGLLANAAGVSMCTILLGAGGLFCLVETARALTLTLATASALSFLVQQAFVIAACRHRDLLCFHGSPAGVSGPSVLILTGLVILASGGLLSIVLRHLAGTVSIRDMAVAEYWGLVACVSAGAFLWCALASCLAGRRGDGYKVAFLAFHVVLAAVAIGVVLRYAGFMEQRVFLSDDFAVSLGIVLTAFVGLVPVLTITGFLVRSSRRTEYAVADRIDEVLEGGS